MTSVSAVLFDLYDTLAWSHWPRLGAQLASEMGIQEAVLVQAFDSTRRLRSIGHYSDETEDMAVVLEACGISPDGRLLQELVDLEADFMATEVHLHDDALETLRRMRTAGVVTGLVSNCSNSTRAVVDRLELSEEMDAVALSVEVGAAKPAAQIFEFALARIGALPSETIFVDDQPRYLDGAAALGMQTFQIARRAGRARVGSHPVIHALAEIDPFVFDASASPG